MIEPDAGESHVFFTRQMSKLETPLRTTIKKTITSLTDIMCCGKYIWDAKLSPDHHSFWTLYFWLDSGRYPHMDKDKEQPLYSN